MGLVQHMEMAGQKRHYDANRMLDRLLWPLQPADAFLDPRMRGGARAVLLSSL